MTSNNNDQQNYQRKKSFYDSVLTIYGRKPVLEALQNNALSVHRLHLADSNKPDGIIGELLTLAQQRNIDICYHDKKALSRISRNGKQDQGVAADLLIDNYQSDNDFLHIWKNKAYRLLAIDGITNPQNLGMIIRSACAGNIDGLLLPAKGSASLSPLVIKASVGTLFKTRLIHCQSLSESLEKFKSSGAKIYSLSSHATESLFNCHPEKQSLFVLGNESDGISNEVNQLADRTVKIPMNNDVESLNVAVTAALIAFYTPTSL